MIDVKQEAELRHVLAHLIYSIEALISGHRKVCQYELDQIKSMVFWEDDDNMTRSIEMAKCSKKKNCKTKKNCKKKK